MKFYINEIHLWLKENGEKRTISFLPNKVNVITGESGTGKSSLITIIDYCLLGSEVKLVEEVINENVRWYGLNFTINTNTFFIARKRVQNQKGSDEVYFSSSGIIPQEPHVSISISDLRKILDYEFSIDSSLTIPYGGKKIQAGSKVSYRYFLLFNTQSSSIILNPNVFFDFELYDSEKYREALDRIFDLSLGVDTVDNVLIREKIVQIEKEIIKLEKKRKLTDKELSDYSRQIIDLLRSAQEYDLIEKRLFTVSEASEKLSQLITTFREDNITTNLSELENLYATRRDIGRKLRNLKSFEVEYAFYKETVNRDIDSLEPIGFIKENYQELILVPEIKSFVEGLHEELQRIKAKNLKKKPFAVDISKEVKELESSLSRINAQIANFPIQTRNFESSIAKFIFIGELKAKLGFYSRNWGNEDYDGDIDALQNELNELMEKLQDNDERRSILYDLLGERIQRYITESNAIGIYKSFKPYVNFKKKILQLREPNTVYPSNIGSSSNYMFLHLFFLLGLHEHFIRQNIPFVPQLLIFDQLSQPYYEEAMKQGLNDINDNGDKTKLTEAFRMLNDFIGLVVNDLKSSFQIILLEHAPPEYWENNGLAHFHLVEEFRNGNALITSK